MGGRVVYRRAYYTARKYGVSEADLLALGEAQGHACAICLVPEETLSRSLDVDHNHVTGEVRGLLCSKCNTAIGKLRADEGPALLLRAAAYAGGAA